MVYKPLCAFLIISLGWISRREITRVVTLGGLLLGVDALKDILWLDTVHFFPKEHLNDKNIIKAVEQQQQEEEDEKIRRFIKAKKRLTQMGREKEAETHR